MSDIERKSRKRNRSRSRHESKRRRDSVSTDSSVSSAASTIDSRKVNRRSSRSSSSSSRSSSRSSYDNDRRSHRRKHNSKKYRKSDRSSRSHRSKRRHHSRDRKYSKSPRSRSRSPVSWIKHKQFMNNSGNEEYKNMFWDGFRWVEKTTARDPALMEKTKPMRQIQIANLPLQLTEQELAELINNYMMTCFLNDEGNLRPVLGCKFQERKGTATIELSSMEEANRLLKLDALKIGNNACKLTKFSETSSGMIQKDNTGPVNIQVDAQAQAAALLAFNALSQKKKAAPLNKVGKEQVAASPTRAILLTNMMDQVEAESKPGKEFEEMLEDTIQVFSRFGQIEQAAILNREKKAAADSHSNHSIELGAIVIVYVDSQAAETAAYNMQGRKYDNREIRISAISNEVCQSVFGLKIEDKN